MKPGILLVANYSNRTGYAWRNIYRLYDTIALAFHRLGYDIHASFATLAPPVDIFSDEAEVHCHQYDPGDRSARNTRQLLRLIRTYAIRHVYLTDQAAFDYRYPLLRTLGGVESIVVHNRISVPDPYPAEYERGLRGTLKALLGRIDLVCADRVYAVSDFVRERLLRKNRLPERRVVTIRNGIDLQRFSPAQTDTYADGYNAVVRIFSAARADQHKGIRVLIHATQLLRERSTYLRFEVRYAGDGPDLQHLKSLVSHCELDSVFRFLGQLQSTDGEVQSADIVVVPSIWGDACPSTVSEALASGKALIATRVGGVPELVGEASNAILIEPADAEALSEALERLIRDAELRRDLGRNARLRAESALDYRDYHQNIIDQLSMDFRSRFKPDGRP